VYNHEEHYEWVQDTTTGLVGAVLQLRLPSLSAPEIGIPLPMLVTYPPGDIIRIIIDPSFFPHKEKGQDHMLISALAYTGELLVLDTAKIRADQRENLLPELIYQHELFTYLWQASA